MKHLLLACSFAVALLMAGAASAEKLDLGKVKCGDWLKMSKDNIAMTLVWLDGYYQDEDADPVIDFERHMKPQ